MSGPWSEGRTSAPTTPVSKVYRLGIVCFTVHRGAGPATQFPAGASPSVPTRQGTDARRPHGSAGDGRMRREPPELLGAVVDLINANERLRVNLESNAVILKQAMMRLQEGTPSERRCTSCRQRANGRPLRRCSPRSSPPEECLVRSLSLPPWTPGPPSKNLLSDLRRRPRTFVPSPTWRPSYQLLKLPPPDVLRIRQLALSAHGKLDQGVAGFARCGGSNESEPPAQ